MIVDGNVHFVHVFVEIFLSYIEVPYMLHGGDIFMRVVWWDGYLRRMLWVGDWWVELSVCLLKRRLLPLLLLAKDVSCLQKLCEPSPLSINILPPCFSLLGRCLPSSDGLLLLLKPLDLDASATPRALA
jgi:hypothetical protein